MRKPVYAICKQQRRRSACASTQSDQHLCCSLPRQYNISSFFIRNFKPLVLASVAVQAGLSLTEDRFSNEKAHMVSEHNL